jgi:hypothetical protein
MRPNSLIESMKQQAASGQQDASQSAADVSAGETKTVH